jgi:hypothetical protein
VEEILAHSQSTMMVFSLKHVLFYGRKLQFGHTPTFHETEYNGFYPIMRHGEIVTSAGAFARINMPFPALSVVP